MRVSLMTFCSAPQQQRMLPTRRPSPHSNRLTAQMSTPKRSPSQRSLLRTPVTSSRSASSWLSRPSVVLPLVGLLVFLLTLLPFTSRLLPHLGTDPSEGGGGRGGQQPLPGPPKKPGGAERVRIGTWNLRFDGLRDRTVPVGQPGDGSEREKVVVDGDGFGERVSSLARASLRSATGG
jgi:hypothetical protein